jgi:hypothetical protein
MNNQSSTFFDSYVPVYDVMPDKWEEAKPAIVEQLKRISNAINIREIGWFLDEELLSGKQFIPSNATALAQGTAPQFRTVLRKVVDCGPLVAGVNPPIPHGVVFDVNLTSIDSWVEATNSVTLQAVTLVYPELVINGPNINITSPGAFDRAFFIWEYTQEL